MFGSDEVFVGALEDAGEEALAEVAEATRERGLDVETTNVRAITHEEILAYARDHAVDVVAMGRHGASDHPAPTWAARPSGSSGWRRCR